MAFWRAENRFLFRAPLRARRSPKEGTRARHIPVLDLPGSRWGLSDSRTKKGPLSGLYSTKGQEAYERPRPPQVPPVPGPWPGGTRGRRGAAGAPNLFPKPPLRCRVKKRATRVKISGRFYCPQPLPCPWGGHSRHLNQGGGRPSPPTAPSPSRWLVLWRPTW